MSTGASQHQARPLWAVNSIVTWVPAIQFADPFVNVPRPPPQPSDHAITQNTINIGTMFGTEKDQINLFLKVNTAVNLYARRLPNSTEVWVLCHFTQTTDRDLTFMLLPYAAGAPFAAEMQMYLTLDQPPGSNLRDCPVGVRRCRRHSRLSLQRAAYQGDGNA
jgi:hypothetical protein